MKTIAYLRVSTHSQDTEKNKFEILKFSNERNLGKVEFIEEIVSGKIPWRQRKIFDVVENLQTGDNLIIPEISRLGRSLLNILEILAILLTKKVNVFSIKQNFTFDSSLHSKIMTTVFSLVAEIEGDLISSRTKEALAARKASGKPLGRPKGQGKSRLDEFKPEIDALLLNGSTKKFIANRYHVALGTLYHWLK
jgi:DNA invertase Pin-like site-specific DNA recombinase